jgi:hypothetical protein
MLSICPKSCQNEQIKLSTYLLLFDLLFPSDHRSGGDSWSYGFYLIYSFHLTIGLGVIAGAMD